MKARIRKLPSPLRKLRTNAGLTLKEAGALIGKSYQTVWNLETNADKPVPGVDLKRYRALLRKKARAG